ncbi:hypothetical protein H6P81_001139 [Aristolochia fimbriata]|uniref:Trafficking protein particle complex subunit 11 n=1 Tax=Aristolochia fimbriata TaxID=158543 RepID=A0AAV7F9X2_ARIFI|nr:hypothetical protein H6P81_001139 [Aristolochia fimbriata]
MEDYAEEIRTPPVALVAVVGVPALHQTISAALHVEQPPINTLALPDFSRISIMTSKQKETLDSSPPGGIMKRDWLAKHRTKIPAVVAALFNYDHVCGDPAQWLQVCTDLENLKAVIRGRNIKLVVVLVQSTVNVDTSEDRLIALRKRAEIDAKYLLVFVQSDPSELKLSLNRLATVFAELSHAYYREEGRKIRTRIEKKIFNSIELYVRYCFKVAVYAEFRRDWAEALKFYEEGYNALREMVGTSTRLPPTQRLVEIKAVAEQLHFKVSTLLLHGGKVSEAISWFWKHVGSYKKLTGLSNVAFLHWEWVSRQFLVFAELLETSSTTIQSTTSPLSKKPLTEWEVQPAYFYQLAAKYLREKKHCLDQTLSLSESSGESGGTKAGESSLESVVPSVYVGQFSCILEQEEAFIMQPLTDEEYVLYAIAEGKRFQESYEIIALLKKSFDLYSNAGALRVASYCSGQMAREYYVAGDFSKAKHLFDGITDLYRKEGWVTLLWEVLGYLRECSRKLGSQRDFIEYSLEMAALPTVSNSGMITTDHKGECGPAGPTSQQQKEKIQREAFGFLSGELQLFLNEGTNSSIDSTEIQPIELEIDLVSPLRAALLVSVAFHDQVVKPGVPTLFTLSLLSQLPLPVEIDQLEVQFNQAICNFTICKLEHPSSVADSSGPLQTETIPNLTLVTNKWLRLTYTIIAGQSGKLECLTVICKIGTNFKICSRAESPASMEELPVWKFEDRVESFPTKDASLSFSGQRFIQVEEPDPQVDLLLDSSGPALVGEDFVVPVSIISKGNAVHSGELKINLVDIRGGGLVSPRDMEPFSPDSLHVELLRVSVSNENESETGLDSIKNIQQSFGLLSVPFLDIEESWSCKLEIRWHRPKVVMLYVSLGYLPSNEATAQKVHVHKSMQIEGKTPLLISHHFMMPFRQDSLLLSKIKPATDSEERETLALDEISILAISARNSSEVPLRLISMSLEAEEEVVVKPSGEVSAELAMLVPGEGFKWVFSVIPQSAAPSIGVGTVSLKWSRDLPNSGEIAPRITTKYKIPVVKVERPPLMVSLECPPHTVLGVPFTLCLKIQNQTPLLQEISYSVMDAQSFVLSGPHNGSIDILPKSEGILCYKLVPLMCGQQQLPRVTVTSSRYAARLQLSIAASAVFVFPSQPYFEMDGKGIKRLPATSDTQATLSVT